ncbi:MAG: dTMP kinase [Desulfatiglandaceae bacterium]
MFITFEGIEGCGKTTQVKRLAIRLERAGIPILMTREPGGTRIGQEIRKILLDARNESLSSLAELFLYAADRSQHIREMIQPALKDEKWVLCDRFSDATTVYQGLSRGLDMDLVANLNDLAADGLRPDLTFLLDCPVSVGLQRAFSRNKVLHHENQDRFEREKEKFHRSVRQGYLDLANREKGRIIVIDATLGEDEMERAIFRHISPLMEKAKEK